ncbi:MAG: phage holin family protein [Hyphomonas sp.]
MLSALSSLLQNKVEAQVSRGIKGLGAVAVVGLMLLTAYIAAVAALGLFLVERMSPWEAAAFIALGFALMGGAILVFMSLKASADERAEAAAAAARQARQDTQSNMLSALTGAEGGGKQVVAIATIAGLILSSFLNKDDDEDDED